MEYGESETDGRIEKISVLFSKGVKHADHFARNSTFLDRTALCQRLNLLVHGKTAERKPL